MKHASLFQERALPSSKSLAEYVALRGNLSKIGLKFFC